MKTYSLRESEIVKDWIVIDATNLVLGRLAAFVANRLRGKHKTTYTPHMDCGDNVIIVNADKIRLTGNKLQNKKFYWHTGHPGGIKEITARKTLESKFPERLLQRAIKRMVPRGPLGYLQLKNLRIFADGDHKHNAQNPTLIDFGALNRKNICE